MGGVSGGPVVLPFYLKAVLPGSLTRGGRQMNIQQLNKNRYLLLVLIVIISLGLVGVALAAAGQAGRSITEIQPPSPHCAMNDFTIG